MKLFALSVVILAMSAPAVALDKSNKSNLKRGTMQASDIQSVAPALEKYTDGALLGDVWKRPDLSPRDRSIVTLAVLITRNHANELRYHLNLALDNGVRPKEISEIITHLAFYAGWGNATSASSVVKDIFAVRKVGSDQLAPASPELLPLNQSAESDRATRVQQSAGSVSPGLVLYTGELLFKDLWLRPDLAPRDRSLVTVSSLIASGQFAQITFHLGKAMDNGLTKVEASEILTQTAFYAGWPNAFSAVPVFKAVFEARAK